MYDVNFCFRNYLENVKIGVTTNIRVTHKSIGETNNSWEKNRVIFSKKYKSNLPSKVKLSDLDNLNILVFTDSDLSDSSIYDLSKNLSSNSNVSVVTTSRNYSLQNELKKEKINVIDIQLTPGFKVGDGKWYINTPNGPELTKPNNYYKISEPKIDLIIFDDKFR